MRADAGVAVLIAVGGLPARAVADGAVEGGRPERVHYASGSSVQAADLAASLVKAGDPCS